MTHVHVRDFGAWDGNQGTRLYAPVREHQLSFVEALERAHPCAAVWWDRDVGDNLVGKIKEVTLFSDATIATWYSGICEVEVLHPDPIKSSLRPFYRLAIDERWYLVTGLDRCITPQWLEARERLVRKYEFLVAKAVAAMRKDSSEKSLVKGVHP